MGDAQTFKILDETTLQILHRSNVRLALSRKTFNHCALFIDPHPVVDSSPPACTASPPINPVVPTPAVHDNSNTPTSILAPTQPTPTSTLTTPTTPSMVHPDDAATSFDQPPQHHWKQRILYSQDRIPVDKSLNPPPHNHHKAARKAKECETRSHPSRHHVGRPRNDSNAHVVQPTSSIVDNTGEKVICTQVMMRMTTRAKSMIQILRYLIFLT